MSLPPIRALVVDDEPLARRRLLGFLAAEPEVVVIGEAESGSKAVEMIAGKRPDLVFLDVQMPGLDGFGVLRCIAGAHLPAVVFVTAYDEHAIRAFEVQAVDYLLKPVTGARFHEAVRRAIARIRSAPAGANARSIDGLLARVDEPQLPSHRIPLRVDGRTELIKVDDLDWIEASGDYLELHSGPVVRTIRATMALFEGRLPEDRFARVHRSVIVNVDRVRQVESVPKGDYVLILSDGTRLRSGRSYREVVQTRLLGK